VKSHPFMLNRRVERQRCGSSARLIYFSLVGPSLQLVKVGSPPCMGCMVPQQYAIVGNQSYPGVLGHNKWPTVPGIIYPDTMVLSYPSPRIVVKQVHVAAG
jgi:hypothetical protein